MSRRSRIQTRRLSRPAGPNPVQVAINRSRLLSQADVHGHRAIVERALTEFCQGLDCAFHWRSLADTLGLARELSAMGIGAGREAEDLLDRAHVALYDVKRRADARGTWTMRAEEMDALRWLMALHCDTQLPACTYGVLDSAVMSANRKAYQARHGNASPGAVLVHGQLGEVQELLP